MVVLSWFGELGLAGWLPHTPALVTICCVPCPGCPAFFHLPEPFIPLLPPVSFTVSVAGLALRGPSFEVVCSPLNPSGVCRREAGVGGFVVVFLPSLVSVLSKRVLRSANMTQMQQLVGSWADLLYILVKTDVFSSWWRWLLMDAAVLRTTQSTCCDCICFVFFLWSLTFRWRGQQMHFVQCVFWFVSRLNYGLFKITGRAVVAPHS